LTFTSIFHPGSTSVSKWTVTLQNRMSPLLLSSLAFVMFCSLLDTFLDIGRLHFIDHLHVHKNCR
jgi:hypothetical protein